MHRKGLVIGILILMLGVNIGSTFAGDVDVKTVSSVGFDGDTLYVGGSGPNNYTTIQSAIDDASNGDTVFVYSGIYYEHIIIYKQISLIGEDKVNTIIDGGGNNSILWENIIRIADDNIQISGLTLRNLPGHTDDGLSCENYDNICIENCIIHTCYNGINILNSENVSISNIIFFNNNHLDIQNYFFSKNHIIQGCTFSDSDSSISFDVENGVIKNCLFSNITAWSIIVEGNNSLVENNSFFEVGQSIRINSGTNITCRNNIIENSQGGISFSSCSRNFVLDNVLTNISQWWGAINLNHATLNYICGNTIINNDIGPGIGLGILSDNNTISENCISNCEIGIRIHYEANNNKFFHNTLISNIQNAYDECNNTWYGYYLGGGNFWSDYTCDDNYRGINQDIPGSDGIGDTPYNISGPGNNTDRYPLMSPHGSPFQPLYLGFVDVHFEKESIGSEGGGRGGVLKAIYLNVNTTLDELPLTMVYHYTIEMNYSLRFPFWFAPLFAIGLRIRNYSDYSWESMKLLHHGQGIWFGNVTQNINLNLTGFEKGDELELTVDIPVIRIPDLDTPGNNESWEWFLRLIYNIPVLKDVLLHNWLLPILAPYNLMFDSSTRTI